MSAIPTSPDLPDAGELEARIIEALKTVYDPEIPVNVYDLGLIYDLSVDPLGNHADIQMTLTAPGCPVAGSMPEWVENAARHASAGVGQGRTGLGAAVDAGADVHARQAGIEHGVMGNDASNPMPTRRGPPAHPWMGVLYRLTTK